jgi:hypothetical protein
MVYLCGPIDPRSRRRGIYLHDPPAAGRYG